ncbi:putative diphthamide synthesis protein [Novymonas esmeraldas]|uniref:Diphthamide synthesis protein n=1 Tax=Novymonas esmeraldas TaxID=1808958 RepID=A0AAW0F529_9TRYP
MFHDAPVEAAVVVHRHRPRHTTTTTTSSAATVGEDEAARRIVDSYQLRRVADFLLSGTPPPASTTAAASPAPTSAVDGGGCCGEATAASSACGCSCTDGAAAPSHDGPFMRVALQFPDELLGDAVAVVHSLGELVADDARYIAAMERKLAAPAEASQVRPASLDNPHRPTAAMRLFVLADNTFGSCCPDEITAQHYTADCIVHFGDACMSRSTRLPVYYVQPVFHLSAIAAGAEDALLDAEATAVLEVVQRVASAIRRRVGRWWAERTDAVGCADAAECAVHPRLAVVGTYPTKDILQAAERRCDVAATSVPVDWPVFEERGVPPHVGVSDAPEASSAAAAAEDSWLVNGVRFPRVASSSSSSPSSPPPAVVAAAAAVPSLHEVQYILFFGAAGSSALVHVLATEQYNQFHYSDLCREYLDWDGDGDDAGVPLVSVVDDTFGTTMNGGQRVRDALRCAGEAGAASAESATAVAEAVQQWVSTACAGGSLASALVTADCVHARHALQRRVRQRAFNIESVRASSAIGILVASLAIEGYYEVTQQLHQLLRAYGKRSYVIYVGHLNEFKLANFVDTVDSFVAVACPYSRQSHFPEKKDGFMKPIVSPAELLVALTSADDAAADELYGMAAVYTTSFDAVLRVLRAAVVSRRREIESRAGGTDADGERKRREEEERWASSGALVRTGGGSGGGGAMTVQASSQGALARFYEREYVGLDPRVGQTPVQTEVLDGKHGIARGYAKEREEQGVPAPPTT